MEMGDGGPTRREIKVKSLHDLTRQHSVVLGQVIPPATRKPLFRSFHQRPENPAVGQPQGLRGFLWGWTYVWYTLKCAQCCFFLGGWTDG